MCIMLDDPSAFTRPFRSDEAVYVHRRNAFTHTVFCERSHRQRRGVTDKRRRRRRCIAHATLVIQTQTQRVSSQVVWVFSFLSPASSALALQPPPRAHRPSQNRIRSSLSPLKAVLSSVLLSGRILFDHWIHDRFQRARNRSAKTGGLKQEGYRLPMAS